jgi:hypothetical protein
LAKTAIDRDGDFQPVVDAADDAGEIAAPTDARDADAGSVHVRQTRQERTSAHDGRDGVVGPHVPDLGVGEGLELGFVALVRTSIGQADPVRTLTGGVHRQSHIAAFGPHLRPLTESLAASAVDEKHRRETAGASIRRSAEVGEDTGRLSVERLAFIEHFLNQFGRRAERVTRRLLQGVHVPRTGVAGSGGRPACGDKSKN